MSSSDARPSPNNYRPDVDGLRALAVLPVILYHSGFLFSGGYVGVDVFFVISGYLITGIVERELQGNRFSLLVFYQRRIRRIFPALFAVLSVSILVACLFFPPLQLIDFGKTLLASAAFSSNFLFAHRSGYFAPTSENAPLLHTWTLSVEEQFYLCWPLILSVLTRTNKSKWKLSITILGLVGTLALSSYWLRTNPTWAFYLLPSRAWELALGSAMSFPAVSRKLAGIPRGIASVMSLTGILALGVAVVTYDRLTSFPGLAALLPCLGAAFAIAGGIGGSSWGTKLLSNKALVGIGLMSYSLYLWHWPILVLGRLIANHKLSSLELFSLVLLTFVASWLSWRFIEGPLRSLRVPPSQSKRWIFGGLATSSVFVAIAAVFIVRHGLPGRGADVSHFVRDVALEQETFGHSPCMVQGASLPASTACLLGKPASKYQGVLWGDSHAAHLAEALEDIGLRVGLTFREMTKAGCPPVPGVQFFPKNYMRDDCRLFNDKALDTILGQPDVRLVVLAARWDAMLEAPVAAYAGDAALLTLDGSRPSIPESRKLFGSALRTLLGKLTSNGRRVVLVGEVPLPLAMDCIIWAQFNHESAHTCETEQNTENSETEALVRNALDDAAANLGPQVQIVRPYESLCGNKDCLIEDKGRPLYLDDSHLSHNGLQLVEGEIEKGVTSALDNGS